MEMTPVGIWSKCLDIIRDNVPAGAYDELFTPIVPLLYDADTFMLQIPSYFFFEKIEKDYATLITKTLARVIGHTVKLKYNVLPIADRSVTLGSDVHTESKSPSVPNRPLTSTEAVMGQWDSQLSPNLHFGNFLAGDSNKLARTAGVSIAENPGKTIFNPLFVYGKSGVGKTHLLHAIGNAVLEHNPKARVLYISSHLFQVQYSQAYLQNTINDFIHFYQSVDVLLIDDVHELSGKTGTQNVFFHIFNHLHQTGKQIVFTCDRSPKELQGMEDRLLTRLKWGLTAEMQRPDYHLRKSILQSKIQRDGLEFSEEVIDFIARNAKDNVRDLEGIATSLMAHSIIEGKDVDLELCKQVVQNTIELKDEEAELGIDDIEEEVCQYYHLNKSVLISRSKQHEVVRARQIAMYLAKKHTSQSLAQIGIELGNRNHATVIHAFKAIEDSLEIDVTLRNDLQRIESALDNRL